MSISYTTIIAKYVGSDNEVLPEKLMVVQRYQNTWTGRRKKIAVECCMWSGLFV